MALALTGDFDGAIADFEFYVAWAPSHNRLSEYIELRKAWIAALKAGKNPFDTATLEQLRNQ